MHVAARLFNAKFAAQLCPNAPDVLLWLFQRSPHMCFVLPAYSQPACHALGLQHAQVQAPHTPMLQAPGSSCSASDSV
jgi:hypothetical protein